MATNPPTFILINTFMLPKHRQDALVLLLEEFTEHVTRFMPGFVSATVHRSLDDTHVANYVRWQTHDDFKAMLADPRAHEHMKQTRALAPSIIPAFYEIAYHCGRPLDGLVD